MNSHSFIVIIFILSTILAYTVTEIQQQNEQYIYNITLCFSYITQRKLKYSSFNLWYHF